jgi:hypothetical protein
MPQLLIRPDITTAGQQQYSSLVITHPNPKGPGTEKLHLTNHYQDPKPGFESSTNPTPLDSNDDGPGLILDGAWGWGRAGASVLLPLCLLQCHRLVPRPTALLVLLACRVEERTNFE